MNEMNEFRKPYEYEEETGIPGLATLFFVMVLCFEVLLGATTLIQGSLFLKPSPWMSTAYFVFGSAYILFMIFMCVALQKIPKYAIQVTKVFLLVRLVYLSLACLVIYSAVSKDIRILQQYSSKSYFDLSYIVIPMFYILGFSICWFWYFCKSKKIKEFQKTANKRYTNQPDGGIDR